MIPRLLHHIWVGDPMPDHLRAYVEAWGEMHPGWEQRIWSEDDLGWLENQRLFDDAGAHAPGSEGQFRADVARYEILHRHGGVYVDCDFEPRVPVGDWLADDVECFAAWETDGVWVNNAIMGCVPGHPFLGELIEGLPLNVERTRGKRPNVSVGPQYLTRLYRRHEGSITVYPSERFFPRLWNQLDELGGDFPDAWAVHMWANAHRRQGVPMPGAA